MPSRRRFLNCLVQAPLALTAAPAPIASPKEALSVFDFAAVAEKKLLPAHWAYLAAGVDDNRTVEANLG